MSARRGMTLIELLVALVVLATLSTLVALSVPPRERTDESSRRTRLFEARMRALRLGHPVVIPWGDSANSASALAMPDGSVISDSGVPIRRLTGVMSDPAQRNR